MRVFTTNRVLVCVLFFSCSTQGSEADDNEEEYEAVCSRTVPKEVAPSIECEPLELGNGYDGCSEANLACGPVIGCTNQRNENIAGTVETEYRGPDASFEPPQTLLPPMGTTIEGWGSGWFARGDGTQATGSCTLPALHNIMGAALTMRQFGQADWCGACAEVVGRSGQRVRVMIIDQCAGCADGGLDLPSGEDSPYRMLNLPGNPDVCRTGLQPIEWRIVPCETEGGVIVHYTEGFNHWTPAVQIRNHRLPIVRVDDFVEDQWRAIDREAHNQYYLTPRSDSQAQPLTLRITAIDGSQISGSFPPFEAGMNYETRHQF